MQKTLVWVSLTLGVACIAAAVMYFVTPAGNLPAYIPGFIADSTKIHYKHGIGALILGLALFAFAWFRSAPFSNNLASDSSATNEK